MHQRSETQNRSSRAASIERLESQRPLRAPPIDSPPVPAGRERAGPPQRDPAHGCVDWYEYGE
jgi:hypothetical protein